METKKVAVKYGATAVIVAIVIIATTIFANPLLSPLFSRQLGPKTTFLIMLTDPPTVPSGTTQLNLTYSGISVHITYLDGTSSWVPVQATGKVNLLSLLNMSQTIASIVLPTGSIVDKIQFGISSVEARVNNVVYPVTMLTNQLLVLIRGNGVVSGATAGVLFDLYPTLTQINAIDSTGGNVNYYVLVPSAIAIVKTNIAEQQREVGARVELDDDDHYELDEVEASLSRNLNIISASLSVKGTITDFSVTVKNVGATNATLFGLILDGTFNETESDDVEDYDLEEESVPFRISGTSLVPLLGENDDEAEENQLISSLTIRSGQSVTLSFSGMLQIQDDDDDEGETAIQTILTPVLGSRFTIRLMGESFKTFNLKATLIP